MLFYVMLFLASLALATLIIWLHGLAKRAKLKALQAKKLSIQANHMPKVSGPGLNSGMRANTPVPEMAAVPASQANSVLSSTWNGSIKREESIRPKEQTQGSLNAYLSKKRAEERTNAAWKQQSTSKVRNDAGACQSTSPDLSSKAKLQVRTRSDKPWG